MLKTYSLTQKTNPSLTFLFPRVWSLTTLNVSCLSPVSPNNFPNEFPLSEFSNQLLNIFPLENQTSVPLFPYSITVTFIER